MKRKTAVFDVILNITYHAPDATHLLIMSKSESVREVSVSDHGLTERDGGVYGECEALVLSR